MKIAFCNRKKWDNPLGGDGVQMLKTKKWLEELYNIQIDIIVNPAILNKTYDLVHIFNYATVEETSVFFQEARKLGLKIVSSPIFWDYKYAITPLECRLGKYPDFIDERKMRRYVKINNLIAHCIGKPTPLSNKFKKNLRDFVMQSDLILPNSLEEGRLLLEYVRGNNVVQNEILKRIKVVYNGVEFDRDVKILSQNVFFVKYNIPRDFILQVGRIQYLKNQLNLLAALMEESDIPIVFLGKIVEYDYYKKIRELALKRGNVYFLPQVDHEDVYSFYYYAKAHVLLSLRESPGLVSLEAASQGCPIVVADKRFTPVETYFPTGVEVVNPLDYKSINMGVKNAYNSNKRYMDLDKFSWKNVAKQTYVGYQLLVDK